MRLPFSVPARLPLRPIRLLALAVACVLAMPAAHAREAVPLQAVRHVDLQRYSGKWYELARLPNFFQRNCVQDATASYTVAAADRLRVVNQCTRRDGSVDVAVGMARQSVSVAAPSGRGPGEGVLQLRFAPQWLSWWPAVWGDYWILAVDDGYETALVGTPDRAYLWLLSRTPRRPAAEIAAWLQKAADLGYPVDRMVRTEQDDQAPPLLLAPATPGAVQPEADWSETVLPAPAMPPVAEPPAAAMPAPSALPQAVSPP